MSNWKDALNDYDLTTSEGLEAVKRLFVEQSRAQQIESLKQEEDPAKILDTFGAIREYNDFIDQSERPQPTIKEPPSLVEAKDYLPDFLIDNWMPADRLTLLTGRGGAGKSYLALQHIAALALGVEGYQLNPFHGTLDELYEKGAKIFKKNPINILIASYEEDLMETWARDTTDMRVAWMARLRSTAETHPLRRLEDVRSPVGGQRKHPLGNPKQTPRRW